MSCPGRSGEQVGAFPTRGTPAEKVLVEPADLPARLGALGVGALTLLLGMGAGQVAGAASTPVAAPNPVTTAPGGNDRAGGQRINDPAATAPGYQRNTRGLTYGSAADAARPDLEPDLVWVVTLQGGSGYVYNEELSPPPPAAPTEVPAAPSVRVLTAYASDGVTPVGTFGVGGN